MADQFDAQVEKFVLKTEAKLLTVVRFAIDDLVEEMQTPKYRGGRMPVDTGFLRKSGSASLNAIPQGEGLGRERTSSDPPFGELPEYQIKGGFLGLVLANMKLGDVFYFGWTAVYARRQEVYNGFLESAAQKWQTFVNNAVKRVKDG